MLWTLGSIFVGMALGYHWRYSIEALIDKIKSRQKETDASDIPKTPINKSTLIRGESKLKDTTYRHLVGICEGILADDRVVQVEARKLLKWFKDNSSALTDVRTAKLGRLIKDIFEDGVASMDELDELKVLMSEFCDNWLGIHKATPQRPKKKAKKREAISKSKAKNSTAGTPKRGDKFDITYCDAKGDISYRDIIFFKSSYRNGIVYISAKCLEADAHRTFCANRIQSCFHMGTGEVIKNPDFYFI